MGKNPLRCIWEVIGTGALVIKSLLSVPKPKVNRWRNLFLAGIYVFHREGAGITLLRLFP